MKTKHLIVGLVVLIAGIVIITLVGTDYSRNGKHGFKPIPKPTRPVQPTDDGGVVREPTPTPSLKDLLKVLDKDGAAASSQPVTPTLASQIKGLRKQFKEVFQKDFTFINDELVQRNYGKFWLVTLKPKRSGYFVVRYTYKTPYVYGDSEYPINVGGKGARRIYIHGEVPIYYPDICVGDCITIPIRLDKEMGNYKFLDTSRPDQTSTKEIDLNETLSKIGPVAAINPVEPELMLMGQYVHSISPVGYPETYNYKYAYFLANVLGRLNLGIGTHEERLKSNKTKAEAEIPIIVMGTDEPITIVACPEYIYEKNKGEKGKIYRKANPYYFEKAAILRPNDMIKVFYGALYYECETSEEMTAVHKKEQDTPPAIKRSPFSAEAYSISGSAFEMSLKRVARKVRGLQEQGRYAESLREAREQLKITEEIYGSTHTCTGISLYDLAISYKSLGKYSAAELLLKQTQAIWAEDPDKNRKRIGHVLVNLASIYNSQARYNKAESLYNRAFEIYKEAYGPEHRNVAAVLNNLALIYKSQGNYTRAETMYRNALDIYRKALGSEHPDVAIPLHNMGMLCNYQRNYVEAESLLKEALDIKEKTLGLNHPSLACSLCVLGEVYRKMGEYAKSEPLIRRAIKIRETSLGSDHPDVATSLNNLAGFYKDTKKSEEAGRIVRKALNIYQKALGESHPDIAECLNNMGEIYYVQGKYGVALPIFKKALTMYEKTLSPDNPFVADVLENMIEVYKRTGKKDEAEKLRARARRIRSQAR